ARARSSMIALPPSRVDRSNFSSPVAAITAITAMSSSTVSSAAPRSRTGGSMRLPAMLGFRRPLFVSGADEEQLAQHRAVAAGDSQFHRLRQGRTLRAVPAIAPRPAKAIAQRHRAHVAEHRAGRIGLGAIEHRISDAIDRLLF